MKLVSSFPILLLLIVTLLLKMSDAAIHPRSGRGGGAAAAATPTSIPAAFYRETNHPSGHARHTSTTQLHYFSGNSEVMLDTVCGYVPWPFRKAARAAFLKEFEGLKEHHITETHVYEAVLKLTPSKFHLQTMQLLDHYKTTTPTD